MRLQADFAGVPVARSANAELSALGTAHMAGLGVGWWSWRDLEMLDRQVELYEPKLAGSERAVLRDRWKKSLAKAKTR